MLTWENNCYK